MHEQAAASHFDRRLRVQGTGAPAAPAGKASPCVYRGGFRIPKPQPERQMQASQSAAGALVARPF